MQRRGATDGVEWEVVRWRLVGLATACTSFDPKTMGVSWCGEGGKEGRSVCRGAEGDSAAQGYDDGLP